MTLFLDMELMESFNHTSGSFSHILFHESFDPTGYISKNYDLLHQGKGRGVGGLGLFFELETYRYNTNTFVPWVEDRLREDPKRPRPSSLSPQLRWTTTEQFYKFSDGEASNFPFSFSNFLIVTGSI